jgi:diguanylate cyclase (GGDEF)-like protein
MSPNKTALPVIFVSIISVPLMIFLVNNAALYISFPVAWLVPYVSITLVFIIILNLAMRQALTMYVASIIAITTILHFYIIPGLEAANGDLPLIIDTKHFLLSFITLLPVFAVMKIPAHKILKSTIYLLGTLVTWFLFSFVITKVDMPLLNITERVFSNIGMQYPFQSLWFSPLQLVLISSCTITLFILFIKSVHNIYLLAISSLATLAVLYMSSLSVIVFAILGSVLCLLSAIVSGRNMAFNDELTGIPGRRSLTQYAEELSGKFTVVMIDIDFFKKFNDKYGHNVGDDVIKLVAGKIAKVGSSARAFRYGGEEFTLIFDGKLIDDVFKKIEHLRVQIETYPIAIRVQTRLKKSAFESKKRSPSPVKENIVKVTCSFGIAESLLGSKDFNATIKRADTALFKAKKGGRNCVRTVES